MPKEHCFKAKMATGLGTRRYPVRFPARTVCVPTHFYTFSGRMLGMFGACLGWVWDAFRTCVSTYVLIVMQFQNGMGTNVQVFSMGNEAFWPIWGSTNKNM